MNIFSKIDCPNNEIIKLFSYHDHFYLCKTHKFWIFSHLIMIFIWVDLFLHKIVQ